MMQFWVMLTLSKKVWIESAPTYIWWHHGHGWPPRNEEPRCSPSPTSVLGKHGNNWVQLGRCISRWDGRHTNLINKINNKAPWTSPAFCPSVQRTICLWCQEKGRQAFHGRLMQEKQEPQPTRASSAITASPVKLADFGRLVFLPFSSFHFMSLATCCSETFYNWAAYKLQR